MKKLYRTRYPFAVVGIGPGESGYRLPLADEEVALADMLMGGERHLALFASLGKKELCLSGRMKELTELIKKEGDTKRIALLVSGDPGFYSPLRLIASRFERSSYRVVPGISSFQLASARTGLPWQEDRLISLHGREGEGWREDTIRALEEGRRAILLTDHERTPRYAARQLEQKDMVLDLFYRLGYEDERRETVTAGELLARPAEGDDKETLCVMIISRP